MLETLRRLCAFSGIKLAAGKTPVGQPKLILADSLGVNGRELLKKKKMQALVVVDDAVVQEPLHLISTP